MTVLCRHGGGGDRMMWVVLGGLEVSVDIASCVFGWTRLAADNADTDDGDDDAYDTKNGVNA
eukprot:8499150-Ditylum_brightwellii.AAC.1